MVYKHSINKQNRIFHPILVILFSNHEAHEGHEAIDSFIIHKYNLH